MAEGKIKHLFLHKIQKTINKFHMLEKDDKVLVAFSGGPDSLALLFSLNELKKKYCISLCACHINHMLRGKEALEDEKIAKKRCLKLKIPCKIVKKDIKKLKKRGESVEEAARRIFNDKKESRKREKFSSIEDLICMNRERKALEIKRYKEWYGINIHDKSHYDIFLDTTKMTIEEVANSILQYFC